MLLQQLSDILEQGEDTLDFLGNYIDQLETDELDKNKLKEFAKEIYMEKQVNRTLEYGNIPLFDLML